MRCHQFLVGLAFFLSCVCTRAREVTDTLESAKGDRAIITYDITENNGHVDIRFLDEYKKLGATFKDKYWNLEEIVVLFFDRIGNYEDNMKFSGINVEALMIPKEINYEKSKDGYFFLHDNPTISLELISEEPAKLSIPMFLAHYEGKRSYKVFSRCENLVIKLSKKKAASPSTPKFTQQVSKTITTQEELEGDWSEGDEAAILINIVYELLDDQEGEGFTDELQHKISELRVIMHSTTDKELSSRINDVLEECKQKERELKIKVKAEAEAKEKADSQRLADMQRQEQARQDSIAAAAQQRAEKDSKRNLWLIIGGVILAVLGFIGNQVFQHFRNVKNQKSIMAMQENVVKRAENEAKRRARNMAQSQVNRVRGEARQGTRNVINAGINKIKQKGKGNKGISI